MYVKTFENILCIVQQKIIIDKIMAASLTADSSYFMIYSIAIYISERLFRCYCTDLLYCSLSLPKFQHGKTVKNFKKIIHFLTTKSCLL